MARISLRAYHREIEDLVESHQYDQAISHCRHILKYYPKNVNTYRLLGKAYLESQRYADASDIFQRVLSSVPDDFVSHVGSSIIREDEGNLDEAIWHMERAFESQPANGAIQSELRRLHGRREGLEPPKIRLTRGALARMYIKGELFQQAIAELRAGLQEEPKRFDLQILLAQAYFASGQRVDAAEICSKILKELPFCLEANRILAEILAPTERAEESKVYASRVQSLDPYTAHLSPAAPTADKVPDAAVQLEKFDWRPGVPITEKPSQPEWASTVGVDLSGQMTTPETVPDWLTASPEQPATSQEATPVPSELQAPQSGEPEADFDEVPIPDWMKDAGWVPATGTVEENAPLSIEEGDVSPEDLAPANIPTWLQSMAPSDQAEEQPELAPESEPETPAVEGISPVTPIPWLDEAPPGPSDSVVTWLENKEEQPSVETPMEPGEAEQEEIPEWLKGLETEPVAGVTPEEVISPTGEEIPASPLEPATGLAETVVEQPIPSSEVEETEEAIQTGEIPDWLQDLKTAGEIEGTSFADTGIKEAQTPDEAEHEAIPAQEIPDWLSALEPAMEGQPASELSAPEIQDVEPVERAGEAVPAEEIPDWLQPMEPSTEGEGITPGDGIEDAVETPLEAAEFPERQVEAPSEETLPVESSDWMRETSEAVAQVDQQPEIELPGAAEPVNLSDDEAFAWLEGLAVKQGAEEALLLTPEERRESPPDWVQKAAETGGEAILPGEEATLPTPLEEGVKPLVGEELPPVEPPTEAIKEDLGTVAAAIEPAAAITGEPEQESEPVPVEHMADMLFWPRETSTAPELEGKAEEPIRLEEEPVFEEDTKPTQVKVTEEVVEGAAIAAPEAILGEETGISIEPGIEQPEYAPQMGEMPAIVDKGRETAAVEPQVERLPAAEELPAELAAEAPSGEELPEWLREIEEVETPAVSEEAIEGPLEETKLPTATEAASTEEEAAFAWLEGLATRQGADEALLLSPEERTETPPEWVIQAMEQGEEEKPLDEEPIKGEGQEELPVWLKEVQPETPVEPPEAEIEPEIPTWLKQPATFDENLEAAGGEPTPLAPELPPWLAGVEKTEEVGEIPAWTPPEETSMPEEEAAVEGTVQPEQFVHEEIPLPIDVNEAGLVDLEQLPEIGFIKAQAILEYRQEHGRFERIDDLIHVQGISVEDIDAIREKIQVVNVPGEETEQPRDENQVALLQARNALVQGDIPTALVYYQALILKSQTLPEVIRDLNEALYRFPVDVEIWQALGDAHSRSGHLQDALDAYTKAEEYLR